MNTSKLLGLVPVVALFSLVACNAPDVGRGAGRASSDSETVDSKTHSFRISASASTKEALGVATWHVITEKESSSTVIEGADANGKVKFASSLKHDGSELRVDSYKAAAGKLTITKSGDDYERQSTIAADEYQRYADAFAADSKSGKSTVEYATANPIAAQLKKLGEQIALLMKKNNAATAAANAAANKKLFDMGQAMLSNLMKAASAASKGSSGGASKSAGGSSGGGGGSKGGSSKGGGSKGGDDDDDDKGGGGNGGDDNGGGGQEPEPQPEPETDPIVDDDDDADPNATDPTDVTEEGNVDGTEADEALDEGADFGEDVGEDVGGGEDLGGDDLGGGEEEFAFHRSCQHLSCSKTTKVCVCTRY